VYGHETAANHDDLAGHAAAVLDAVLPREWFSGRFSRACLMASSCTVATIPSAPGDQRT
jgi:hypothetical protein